MTVLLLSLGSVLAGAAAAASVGFAGALLLAVIDDSQVTDQSRADSYSRWIQRSLTAALVAAVLAAALIGAAALVGQWPAPAQGWLIAALGSAFGFAGTLFAAVMPGRSEPAATPTTTADPVQEDPS